jgi:hypothetical protein
MSNGSASAPSAQRTPQRSSKKLVWIIVSVVLALLVLFMLFVGSIIFAVFSSIKSSEPYKHAVEVATHDPRVLGTLGPPVKPGWMGGSSISVAGETGKADLSIPISGTAHKGTLYVVARKSEGEWTYQKLTLRLDDGPERIDLLRPPGGSPPRER